MTEIIMLSQGNLFSIGIIRYKYIILIFDVNYEDFLEIFTCTYI